MGSAFRVGNALRSIIMNVAINVKNLRLRHFFLFVKNENQSNVFGMMIVKISGFSNSISNLFPARMTRLEK